MKKLSWPLFLASKLSFLLAVYGALSQNDLWLAPTQWLLVAVFLMVEAIYVKGGCESCGCGGGSK